MKMMVKVCGMRDAENIREVEALGIDLMGFIFYDKSPRYVAQKPEYLPVACRRVGVFVNAEREYILEQVADFELDYIQLHGSESPEFCASLRGDGARVIKAISIADESDIEQAKSYDGCCDLLLFDTKCSGYGGSGESFDWSILDSYKGATDFMLSGGIGVESGGELRGFYHPQLVGYDINSRFELEPALKDISLIKRFIEYVN